MAGKSFTKYPEKLVEENIINACQFATLGVFKVTAGVDVHFVTESMNGTLEKTRGVTGSIKLFGDWNGTLSLSLSFEMAKNLTARIICCDPKSLHEACVKDGVGELTNQIAGGVMTRLSQEGLKMEIGIPEIEIIPDWKLPPGNSKMIFLIECHGQPMVLQLS